MGKTLRWLTLNDFHIGHTHVSPEDLHARLQLVVYPLLPEIDLLTIGGDFFDNALYLDNRYAVCSNVVMHELILKAKEYGFAIRAIRGTYTHDRDQLRTMAALANKRGIDFAYHTDVAVDTIRGFSFLYLPDNLPRPALESLDLAQELLEPSGGIVDCVVGHGYFEHALPTIASVGKHLECFNAEYMRPWVNKLIIMGHIHKASNYKDFVYYTGSFDRLAHGEEEEKGCLLIVLSETDTKVNFIPNHLATPHCTVRLTKETIEDCLQEVRSYITTKYPRPPYGYLRIAGTEYRTVVASILRNEYQKSLVITDLDTTVKQKSADKDELTLIFKTYSSDVPTEDNIGQMLYGYLNINVSDFPLTEAEIISGIHELKGSTQS